MALRGFQQLGNAFTILKVEEFPDFERDVEYSFEEQVPAIEDFQATKFWRGPNKRLNDPELPLEQYNVVHERPKRKLVRVQNVESNGFLEQRYFKGYLYREDGILLCHTSKDTAWDFRKVISGAEFDEGQVELKKFPVSLTELFEAAEDASGAWFRFAETDRRRALAIFADNMELTREFQNAMREGRLSALQFDYNWSGDIISVSVSSKGTVQILESDLTPDQQLAAALRIWVDYLAP